MFIKYTCTCDRFFRLLGSVAIAIYDAAFVAVRVHLLPSPKVGTYTEKAFYTFVLFKTWVYASNTYTFP